LIEPLSIVLAAQATDGIGLNVTTFGVVSAVVLALVGAITWLFKMVTANDRQQILDLKADKEKLEEEKREMLETVLDVLRTGHRATDAADEATRELLKRQAKRPK
jgi:hypothetical protein